MTHIFKNNTSLRFIVLLFIFQFLISCNQSIPKPYGYNRLDISNNQKKVIQFDSFSFDISENTHFTFLKKAPQKEIWFNIEYPQHDATIYCTYLAITPDNLNMLNEDSHKLAYSHAIKADAIYQTKFTSPTNHTSGILYTIKGNIATPFQFYLTDSTHHYIRGSFYYKQMVNSDSVAPITAFIEKEIKDIFNSFEWKKD